MVKCGAAWVLLLLALLVAPAGHAQDAAAAFDRPGMGFASSTLPRGGIAWEQGLPDVSFSHDGDTRSRQWLADSLLRLGLTDTLELQLGADSYGWLRTQDASGHWQAHGMGDSRIGLKTALPSRWDALSWALLATANLPTGRAPLGGGQRGYDLGITAQWALAHERSVAIFIDRSMGAARGWMIAPSVGYAINQDWGGYVEAGIGTGAQQGRQLGTGLTWQPSPRLQWDISVLRGVAGAPDWQAGLGVSWFVP